MHEITPVLNKYVGDSVIYSICKHKIIKISKVPSHYWKEMDDKRDSDP
jgi:hypothetical protein